MASYREEVRHMQENQPVIIPARVLEGLEAVRSSGRVNMADSHSVQYLCHQFGYHEAVSWLEDHPGLYAKGLLQGFAAATGRVEPDSLEGEEEER
jgi:Domain of unknown function (DUF5049)